MEHQLLPLPRIEPFCLCYVSTMTPMKYICRVTVAYVALSLNVTLELEKAQR